jgi:Zn-dependent protease with chaperone function
VIVITDQLVALAGSDEEILAVYLQEVGHARGRHAETMAIQNSAWLVILALITGDVSGVSEALFALPVILGQMAFSRELEYAADDYAMARLLAAGISPDHLATLLVRLNQPDGRAPATGAGDTVGETADGGDPTVQRPDTGPPQPADDGDPWLE